MPTPGIGQQLHGMCPELLVHFGRQPPLSFSSPGPATRQNEIPYRRVGYRGRIRYRMAEEEEITRRERAMQVVQAPGRTSGCVPA